MTPRNAADSALWTHVDVENSAELRVAISSFRPTHVVHLAARTDLLGKQLEDYGPNLGGVDALLAAVAQLEEPVARLIVASSRMVCRIGYQPRSDSDYCPPNAYGESKVETERRVRTSDLPWVLVRPTSIWGPWFDVPYRDFFLSVASGRYVHPTGRRIEKSFGYVGNTTWQLHQLLTAPAEAVVGRTFYLADDPPIEVRDFADRISTALGRRKPRTVPLPLLNAVAKGGDLLERTGRRAPLTSFRLANLLTTMIHDLSPLTSVAGQPLYDLDTGIASTTQWMQRQGLVGSSERR